jgi:CubicO group peptidase (beta-lactamase class C family)
MNDPSSARLVLDGLGRTSFVAACVWVAAMAAARAEDGRWTWASATPESQGMDPKGLESAWDALKERHTTALVVIRHDRIVFERYAAGFDRHKPHYTASMAKALVGGASLMIAMADGRIGPDDAVGKYVTPWRDDPKHQPITIRHLATHTSGIEDAEEGALPHAKLMGWKGDFWKRLEPPRDPFTIARDLAPVLDEPGTRYRYSNPGMAMLGYCVTVALRGTKDEDLRSLLKRRIMAPMGVPDSEWSTGYGGIITVDGLPLVSTWGGGAYSPDAVARVGRLMLLKGDWDGARLVAASAVEAVTRPSGLPGHSGLGWWTNRGHDGSLYWPSAPDDAFAGAGAGQQLLMVIPSLDLILVRNGDALDPSLGFEAGIDRHVIAPILRAVTKGRNAPYPASPAIRGVRWDQKDSIRRQAKGSDTWPLTWADDALYGAFGDGNGFEPFLPDKLSLGFARITGGPDDFHGENIRSPTGERKGEGPSGEKASGLLMVDGVLYLWARNAGNARLAWSPDCAKSWTWADWRFESSFGAPTFLNFGKDYAGARDNFVYIYSHDSNSAYRAADRMVLARVPRARIQERAAYEFFREIGPDGKPSWTADVADRGAVFEHPGGCYRSAITYNPGLGRYLWCQTLPGGDARFRGGFGIYDAPEPWGPWTTAFFAEDWDVGPGETSSLPPKWMSPDGSRVHLVFSGDDAFSVRGATFDLAGPRPRR